jgi:hypothetical protein
VSPSPNVQKAATIEADALLKFTGIPIHGWVVKAVKTARGFQTVTETGRFEVSRQPILSLTILEME